MTNLLLIIPTLLLFCSSTCWATVYTVGDSSGWDISTDVGSWGKDKTFAVGDTLQFQYSQYHSVSEVSKENYEGCNTANTPQSSSNGNTTIALTGPGDRYFVCGNRLHCLAGMKLHVNVVGNGNGNGNGALSSSPAGAPKAQPGGNLPPGSSRNSKNNPSNNSSIIKMGSLIVAFFGSLAFLFRVV